MYILKADVLVPRITRLYSSKFFKRQQSSKRQRPAHQLQSVQRLLPVFPVVVPWATVSLQRTQLPTTWIMHSSLHTVASLNRPKTTRAFSRHDYVMSSTVFVPKILKCTAIFSFIRSSYSFLLVQCRDTLCVVCLSLHSFEMRSTQVSYLCETVSNKILAKI